MNNHHILAAKPYLSYRYKGKYGWIYIGAMNERGALKEAARSTVDKIERKNLQKWDGANYINV